MKAFLYLVFAAVLALLSACASVPDAQGPARYDGHESLHALLWMQTAVEFRAVAQQAYQQATDALAGALADRAWTAALEQTGDFASLPAAVILDIDETVLDNSPFQGTLVKQGIGFDNALWREWALRGEARGIPGARAFIDAARAHNVEIFYITNREVSLEAATVANLQSLGIIADAAHVLSRNEEPSWGSDKSSRRARIATSHRVLLVIGDDFNDFVAARTSPAEREKLATEHAAWWGRRWFMLPNPVYGSWESALYGHDSALTADEALRRKIEQVTERR
jgi:acid phosphatase